MELRIFIMIVNSKNQPKKQLSVNLGEELSIKLDAYCQLTNTKRSDVIRAFIATLPEQGILDDISTKSLLSDQMYLTRIIRFLLIAKTLITCPEQKKEAQELCRNLLLYLK